MNKSSRQITVSEMAPHVHSFSFGENKVDKLTNWLKKWIETSIKNKTVSEGDFLPNKGDLAFHIGVSLGTMQTVFRRLEDEGIVVSKQKIGTYIKGKQTKIIKLTSKRDIALNDIKRYISKNLKTGDTLPPSRQLACIINVSATTVQTCLKVLVSEGIIVIKNHKATILSNSFDVCREEQKTVVVKLSEKIKIFLEKNYKHGEKIPSNIEFAKSFDTSVKTIHDALKILEKDGFIVTKRGKYGTIIAGEDIETKYTYEKILLKIRQYISKNCQIGDKLPTMKMFAQYMNVSTKTIKNAMDILADEGFLTFVQGRNGGTFVTDIPQNIKDTYTWIALNPDYIYNLEPPNKT